MLPLVVPWSQVDQRVLAHAEGRATAEHHEAADVVLSTLGLVQGGNLSPAGERYYMAQFVTGNADSASSALAAALETVPEINAFCESLWGRGSIPVVGATSLAKRLAPGISDVAIRRSFELLNKAGMIVYNRNSPTLRVVHNPNEFFPKEDAPAREQRMAHVVSPDTPYGNLVALRDLLSGAREWIRWYEPHFDTKVLEVLYKEIDGQNVQQISILSGPANVNENLKSEFKRFQQEMRNKRGITAEWRVLNKKEAREIHDRFFLTRDFARNLPPLNTILMNSTGEILPSQISPSQFDAWWAQATPVSTFVS